LTSSAIGRRIFIGSFVKRNFPETFSTRALRELAVIPDYEKLGYEIAAFTLVKIKSDFTKEELKKARESSLRDMQQAPTEIVLFEIGLGDGRDGVLVSFHERLFELFQAQTENEAVSFSRFGRDHKLQHRFGGQGSLSVFRVLDSSWESA
jgi:hypothetical protein